MFIRTKFHINRIDANLFYIICFRSPLVCYRTDTIDFDTLLFQKRVSRLFFFQIETETKQCASNGQIMKVLCMKTKRICNELNLRVHVRILKK